MEMDDTMGIDDVGRKYKIGVCLNWMTNNSRIIILELFEHIDMIVNGFIRADISDPVKEPAMNELVMQHQEIFQRMRTYLLC